MASDKVIDSAVLQYPAVLSPFEIPSVRYPPPEFIVPCSAASVFALSASSMGKTEYDMLQGIPAVENGFTNPAYNLSYDEYKEWLRITDNNSIGKDLPEGWIPYTTYFLYIDDIPVGYGRVRHSSSEYLETVVGAGNLGYGIAKGCRGKGYGSMQTSVRLLFFLQTMTRGKLKMAKQIVLVPDKMWFLKQAILWGNMAETGLY